MKYFLYTRSRRGFTLIELLIVVAIIAILAAIAVPNFLEAQTRAKVSRVKADFRSVSTAIESYLIDYNQYPVNLNIPSEPGAFFLAWLSIPGASITSPIAYMTSIPEEDIFKPQKPGAFNPNGYYQYFYYGQGQEKPYPNIVAWMNGTGYAARDGFREAYSLVSWGPDREQSNGEHIEFPEPWLFTGPQPPTVYDPTNGTVSNGDIVRLGGGTQSPFASLAN